MTCLVVTRRQALGQIGGVISAAALSPRLYAAEFSHWAAIAYSPSSQRSQMVWEHANREAAESAALRHHSSSDAVVAISGKGKWLAIATTPSGGWGAGSGTSLEKAAWAARDACQKRTGDRGKVRACVYGGKHGVDFSIELSGDFSREQRQLLLTAILHTRYLMCLIEVKRRLDDVATNHYYARTMIDSTFSGQYTPDDGRLKRLMYMQLASLAMYSCPAMIVGAYYEDSNYWAKAPVGCVSVPYGATSDISGRFDIMVNLRWLGATGEGSNVANWAGVLAHELMHNLGHLHRADEYGDHLQINAIQQLVRTQGNYKSGSRCPAFACDCRSHW
jgi:hypothetical protein